MKGLLLLMTLTVVSSSASGFVIPTTSSSNKLAAFPTTLSRPEDDSLITQQTAGFRSSDRSSALSMAGNDDNNNNTPNISIGKLIGPVIISFFVFQGIINLTTELPAIFTGQPNPDYLGTIFDVVFVGWAGQTLLLQTGILADAAEDEATGIQLEGMECQINVNVGREEGTWMEEEWAASGARLVLPVNVRFTYDRMDLGIPGEESLGGRYCRRLTVLDETISFVGPQGVVEVPVRDGGWATLPILDQRMKAGERKLRFFLEFPQGAQRNDVSIPAGRVFFSSAVFPADSLRSDDLAGVPMIKAPGEGAGILKEGGVTIKAKPGIGNLWGIGGDINLILGRFSVSESQTSNTSSDES